MDQPFKKSKMRAIAAAPRARSMNQAFTLIELAVVLAIIGILVGSIMGGTAYIKNAQQKTTINEGKLYLNALKQFELKYGGALPGDMGNATDYWSSALNGNGNGYVGDTNPEFFYAFKHLQLAGLINGNYTGLTNGGTTTGTIGVNIPALSTDGASGFYRSISSTGEATAADPNYFEGFYGTVFIVGGQLASNLPLAGFLSPNDMQAIDTKYDDGQASTGWIRSFKHYSTCVSGTQYLQSTTIACTLVLSKN